MSERRAKADRAIRTEAVEQPARNNLRIILEHFRDTVVVLGCEAAIYAFMQWGESFLSLPADVFRYAHSVLRWFLTATVTWFAVDSFIRIVFKSIKEIGKAEL